MIRLEASLAVALALSMALLESACVLTGQPKPATPAVAPPQPAPVAVTKPAPQSTEPLSVPQTQVQLPPPQLVPETVALPPKPEEPAATPVAPRPPRRTGAAAPQPKQEPPVVGPPAAANNATAATPVETELAPVQEVIPADEKKRYQDSAQNRRAEIRQLLSQIKTHRPTAEQNREVKRIQSLVTQSEEVEKRGDMRQADALAERGLTLARGLNGK